MLADFVPEYLQCNLASSPELYHAALPDIVLPDRESVIGDTPPVSLVACPYLAGGSLDHSSTSMSDLSHNNPQRAAM